MVLHSRGGFAQTPLVGVATPAAASGLCGVFCDACLHVLMVWGLEHAHCLTMFF